MPSRSTTSAAEVSADAGHALNERKVAIANPSAVTSPTSRPPMSCASGIIDSASIARIAPAANDWTIAAEVR